MTRPDRWTRRRLIGGSIAIAGTAALSPARAAALVATPRQTRGPFYPAEIPLDADSDLVQVQGRSDRADGQVVHLFGQVLDVTGRPLGGAVVEIWQCDARGFYHHPGDRGGRADADFQGFGRTVADEAGRYRFRTIKPVPYPGRTPHIHMAVLIQGMHPLSTQIYIKDHPLNAGDFVLRRIADPRARRAVEVEFEPAPEVEDGALKARFDPVLA